METTNGNIGNCCKCGGCNCQQKHMESSESKQAQPDYCNPQPFPFPVKYVTDVILDNVMESRQSSDLKYHAVQHIDTVEDVQGTGKRKKTTEIQQVDVPEIELRYISPAKIMTAKKLSTSHAVADMFREIVGIESMPIREYAIAIYLNQRLNPIGYQILSFGGIDGTVVDVRLIFSVALKCLATGLVIAHNHPSGGLVPSEQDISITKKVEDAGKLLSIRLLDHAIVTTESHYSLSDNGLLGIKNELSGLTVTVDKAEEMGDSELSDFRTQAQEFLRND